MWHYACAGQGKRAMVFLHGFGGAGGVWTWEMERFQSSRRLVAVDLPGHGQTPWTPSTLEDMAQGVIDILDAERILEADIVASSFGGLVALKLWEQAPACVRSLSLAGSLPRFTAVEGFPAGLTVRMIEDLGRRIDRDVGKALDMFVRSLMTHAERESAHYPSVRVLRRALPLPSREALRAVLGMLAAADLRETLSRVSCPVLFIFGDSDDICRTAVVPALRALVPGARITVLPQTGHFPFLTRPEAFNRILEENLL